MISNIRIEMLGGLSVWADGVVVLDNSAKINKPWQVFCFLVLNRNAPTVASRLLAALWADEDLTDPANVLKNTIYALRREFKDANSTRESPILFENGGYLCNPAIHFEVDVEEFEQKAKQGAAAEWGDEKLRLLDEAVGMYKGELMPQLESEIWVMPLALFYRTLFGDSVKALCTGYFEAERFNEMLSVATAANRIDPLEESYYTFMFRALYAMEMYRAIIPAYNKTARIFSEELGTAPNKEIQDIYNAAADKVDSIEQDIMIIKNELREVAGDGGIVNGPLYCTYDVFKYLYQMVARSSERSGGRVVVVLLTLKGKTGESTPAKVISAAMNHMKGLLLGGLLRKSDTVARYSKSQYIVMLSVEKMEGAEIVMGRIHKKCTPFLQSNSMELAITAAELDAIG